jgi:hypothetical protein
MTPLALRNDAHLIGSVTGAVRGRGNPNWGRPSPIVPGLCSETRQEKGKNTETSGRRGRLRAASKEASSVSPPRVRRRQWRRLFLVPLRHKWQRLGVGH